MSDPAEIGAPLNPAVYRRPAPARGWAMAVVGVVCLGLGLALGAAGVRLTEQTPPAPAPLATTEPPQPAPPPNLPSALELPPQPQDADLGDLEARVARLEQREGAALQAAGQALAAAALIEAARGSQPFIAEAAAVRAAAPPSPEIDQLARLAAIGAPSRQALAAGFASDAARAAAAIHAPKPGDGLAARLVHALAKIVSVRPVGAVGGEGPDALLARAEQRVGEGDLEHALPLIDRLPPAARDALAPWRARAERRLEIDRALQSLRLKALGGLAAATRDGG